MKSDKKYVDGFAVIGFMMLILILAYMNVLIPFTLIFVGGYIGWEFANYQMYRRHKK